MLNDLLGIVVVFATLTTLLSCGEDSRPAPSAWVGAYTVTSKHFENGKALDGTDVAYYRIGGTPRPFICLNAQAGTGCVVYGDLVENTASEIAFFAPSATHSVENGLPIPGQYDHLDLTVTLYAKTQTAEVLTLQYTTNSPDYSRPPPSQSIFFTTRDTGSYTKTDSNDSDCRKYAPPCKN